MPKLIIPLNNESETLSLAREFATLVQKGDLVTLSGELGAGKTMFAREFIRHLLGNPELEVPSPTYLIALEYTNERDQRVTHMDLYRICDPQELIEIGLEESIADGIAIIEWPEKAKDYIPEARFTLALEITGDVTRDLIVYATQPDLDALTRSMEIGKFICSNWANKFVRTSFSADASARKYELIKAADETCLLMDDPAKTVETPYSTTAKLAVEVKPFVAIAQILGKNNFRAPEIIAADLDAGLVLLEHLGEGKITDDNNLPIAERYIQSSQLLAQLHPINWSGEHHLEQAGRYEIPDYDVAAMMIEVQLLTQWFLSDNNSKIAQSSLLEFEKIWTTYANDAQDFERSIVMRDYHSPNIIWNDNEHLMKRIGLIDFQDALIGPCAYDVVSLAQDARISISPKLEIDILNAYMDARSRDDTAFNREQFQLEYAVMGAQRASKILGIFVRLDKRDNKPQYRSLIPQVLDYLQRNLAHPYLHKYRQWCEKELPQ